VDAYRDDRRFDQELFAETAQRHDALADKARLVELAVAARRSNDPAAELRGLFAQDDDGRAFRHQTVLRVPAAVGSMRSRARATLVMAPVDVPGVRVGCAGWSLPRAVATDFPPTGTHLQRYAACLSCTEINSSFYRPHRTETYARWASSVPADFRFAVKLPRAITHDARLRGTGAELDRFLAQVRGLGNKLGCVLIQLPPSLAFERQCAKRFFGALRRRHTGAAVVEPRHASWFADGADALLADNAIGRVAADPALSAAASMPGGDRRFSYFRLHGSPRMYFSIYSDRFLRDIARRLRAEWAAHAECWCIFDNTAHGGALPNALRIGKLLRNHPGHGVARALNPP
jgi:uncharacterized protein YecE (DUF72 family)